MKNLTDFDPLRALRLAGVLYPALVVAIVLALGGPAGCRRPRGAVAFDAEVSLAEQVKLGAEEVVRAKAAAQPIEDVKAVLAATRAAEAPPEEPAAPTPKPPPPPPPPSNLVSEADNPAHAAQVPRGQDPPEISARFVLKGIVWSETEPLALVNDQTLGVGEMVGGRKLIRIEREKVVLSSRDGTTTELIVDEGFGSEPR